MDQNMSGNIMQILEKILGTGLVINGEVKIDKLTLTSVDKAKSLGLVPGEGQPSQEPGQSEKESPEQEQQNNSEQKQSQSEEKGSPSRAEFDSIWEELAYLRKLMESSTNGPVPTKGKNQGK